MDSMLRQRGSVNRRGDLIEREGGASVGLNRCKASIIGCSAGAGARPKRRPTILHSTRHVTSQFVVAALPAARHRVGAWRVETPRERCLIRFDHRSRTGRVTAQRTERTGGEDRFGKRMCSPTNTLSVTENMRSRHEPCSELLIITICAASSKRSV